MRNVVSIGFALGMGLVATACGVDMNVGDWLKSELENGNGNGNGNGKAGSNGNGQGNGKAGSNGNGGSSGSSGEGNAAGGTDAGTVCVDQEQGSETSCKDVGTWKLYASQACESNSQMLADYVPREECGDGLYRYVDYTCCPLPPTPLPNGCFEQEQGSETSCKDVGTWKLYASQACESNNQMLGDYVPREECGDGLYRYVDYTCCPLPPTEPPPPNPGCIKQEQGGETSCKDVVTWKQYAAEACESSGMLFTDYAEREECGPNAYRYVDYTCCPKDPPTTPTDCVYPAQGGPDSCKDIATWKLYASQDCDAGGRMLTQYETQDECGDGLYRYVKYTCCP